MATIKEKYVDRRSIACSAATSGCELYYNKTNATFLLSSIPVTDHGRNDASYWTLHRQQAFMNWKQNKLLMLHDFQARFQNCCTLQNSFIPDCCHLLPAPGFFLSFYWTPLICLVCNPFQLQDIFILAQIEWVLGPCVSVSG